MSWESSRYTPCRSAFQFFPCQGATFPSPTLIHSPGYPKPWAALRTVINSSTSADVAATRAAPDPHQCPVRPGGHPSSSQRCGAFPQALGTWRMGWTSGKHLCTSVPIRPSPSSCSSSWAGSRLCPALPQPHPRKAAGSRLARDEGFGRWSCAPRHSIKPELSRCYGSHSSSHRETQLCRGTGGRCR